MGRKVFIFPAAALLLALSAGAGAAHADTDTDKDKEAPKQPPADAAAGPPGLPAEAMGEAPPALPPPEPPPPVTLPEAVRPTIKTWVDHRELGLGEVVRLTVEIRRKPEHEFHLPGEVTFGQLDLIHKSLDTVDEKEGGWKKDTYTFDLIALTPGKAQIPPLKFGGVTKAGEILELESRKIELTTKDPTAGAKEPQLREAAPTVKVYEKNYLLLYFFAVLAGVFAVIALVWIIARNWEKWHPKAQIAPPPPRPPEEVAYEKLAALRGKLPEDLDDRKIWYVDLSEIMREYLANRFDFDALESTSEEIIESMKMKKTVGITQAELWKFLVACDMVKFAKYSSSNDEDKELVDEAFNIVKVTTPRKGEDASA
ncbi:MAG: BatD family protein [Pseudomonadota bacterium]